jgi:predicted RNA binding protein YcfA (HicA-like mRNA interferase family)
VGSEIKIAMSLTVTSKLRSVMRVLNSVLMKVREAIKLIEADGWYLIGQVGSHRQFKHPVKSGRVTVAGHPSSDLHPKTQASILRQAGIRIQ